METALIIFIVKKLSEAENREKEVENDVNEQCWFSLSKQGDCMRFNYTAK